MGEPEGLGSHRKEVYQGEGCQVNYEEASELPTSFSNPGDTDDLDLGGQLWTRTGGRERGGKS